MTAGRTITILIPGHNPAPQGSKKYVGHRVNKKTGKSSAVLVEQSERVAPWRDFVTLYTRQAMAKHRAAPLDGPLEAEIIFTMKPPKNRPKRKRTWPSTRAYGDLDKLLRSTFDGVADGGAVVDDSRIVRINAAKLFPGDPGALSAPGAVVRITQIGDE